SEPGKNGREKQRTPAALQSPHDGFDLGRRRNILPDFEPALGPLLLPSLAALTLAPHVAYDIAHHKAPLLRISQKRAKAGNHLLDHRRASAFIAQLILEPAQGGDGE